MNSPDYVHDKMHRAILSLCDQGTFEERLLNATMSSLFRLEDTDLIGELADDLKFILDWTQRNVERGCLRRNPNEEERQKLIDKMLHVLLETAKK